LDSLVSSFDARLDDGKLLLHAAFHEPLEQPLITAIQEEGAVEEN